MASSIFSILYKLLKIPDLLEVVFLIFQCYYGSILFFLMFTFEREGAWRERERARAGEGQREGDTESEAGSRL